MKKVVVLAAAAIGLAAVGLLATFILTVDRHYEYRCREPGIVESRRVGGPDALDTRWEPTGVRC